MPAALIVLGLPPASLRLADRREGTLAITHYIFAAKIFILIAICDVPLQKTNVVACPHEYFTQKLHHIKIKYLIGGFWIH